MKKNYILAGLTLAGFGFASFQHLSTNKVDATIGANIHQLLLNGGGSPGGRAGAPGDAACASCHSNVTAGTNSENQLALAIGVTPQTTYLPGQSYTLGILINNAVAVDAGFEVAAETATGAQAGTLTGNLPLGTKVISFGGKQRGTHSNSSNTSWGMTWVAPATNVGPVTFYLSTFEGGFGGGKLRVSQHVFNPDAAANVGELAQKVDGNVYFNNESNSIVLDLNTPFDGEFNVSVVDLSGKTVEMARFGNTEAGDFSKSVRLSESIPNGVYIVNASVGNNFITKRIMVTK